MGIKALPAGSGGHKVESSSGQCREHRGGNGSRFCLSKHLTFRRIEPGGQLGCPHVSVKISRRTESLPLVVLSVYKAQWRGFLKRTIKRPSFKFCRISKVFIFRSRTVMYTTTTLFETCSNQKRTRLSFRRSSFKERPLRHFYANL